MSAQVEKGCCVPSAAREGQRPVPRAHPAPRAKVAEIDGMCAIPGGTLLMGAENAQSRAEDGEGPVREVTLGPFLIDRAAVTNAQFAAFVSATGYVTDAERFGWSFVFRHGLSSEARGAIHAAGTSRDASWWIAVRGAAWRTPEGPGSSISARQDHPVVHVSWNDAAAFARWAGKRLPTEAEWEMAARGGRAQTLYPWGDELTPGGVHQCNIWQGDFPLRNSAEDGYAGTAPAAAFSANGFGLHNVVGNVWEWCADWWSTDWHVPECPVTRANPQGPASGPGKVIRGGSYLCHASYCNRYRLSARTFSAPDMSSGHTGFRCARDE